MYGSLHLFSEPPTSGRLLYHHMAEFYADHFLLHDGFPLSQKDFSTVRLATDFRVSETVVLKVLHFRGANKNDAATMWHREADALTGFTHPSVAKLIEQFTHDDDLCLVLEHVPNRGTLHDLIGQIQTGDRKLYSLAWCVKQLRSLLEALNALHARGVVHRDLNPKNLLVTESAEPEGADLVLIDFGISKVLTQDFESGHSVGSWYTAPYVAPEQIYQHAASAESDLYLFGMVALSLLSSTLLRKKVSAAEVSEMLGPVAPNLHDPELASELTHTLQLLLNDAPENRPRLPEVDFVLQRVLHRVTDRAEVYIGMPTRNLRKLGDEGITQTAFLEDLNAEPMGRMDENGTILLFGKRTRARLREDTERADVWVLVDAYQESAARLAQLRKSAVSLPFRFRSGSRAEADFTYLLERERRREHEARDNRAKRETHFDNAVFILKKHAEWEREFTLVYEALEPSRPRGGKNRARRQEDVVNVPAHHSYRLRLLHVSLGDADAAPDGEEGGDWDALEDLLAQPGVAFSYHAKNRARSAGTLVNFDRSAQTLTLSTEKSLSLPKRGYISIFNIASRISLNRQLAALEQFVSGGAASELLSRQLLDPSLIRTSQDHLVDLIQPLVPERAMQDLVERAVNADAFFLLQGPPGTGKTTTIVEVVAQLLSKNPRQRILVTSQSNQAVDNVMSRLAALRDQHGQPWRLVRDSREPEASPASFDPTYRRWCEGSVAKCRTAAEAYRADGDVATADKLRQVLSRWCDELPQAPEVRDAFMTTVQVHGATCSRVPEVQRKLDHEPFDWVILDEAAKTLDTEVLIPLIYGKKFLLVGDQKQLKPFLDTRTVRVLREAGKINYHMSLFERLFELVPAQNRDVLTVQYRMHRSIGDFVARLFYADLPVPLRTGVPDEDRDILVPALSGDNRVVWLDVRGQEQRVSTSYQNNLEARGVYDLLRLIEARVGTHGKRYKVGVITPYRSQVAYLKQMLGLNAAGLTHLDIDVATVDSFQGEERDIILYSLVRTSSWGLKFPAETDRLNVSFSRAKLALVIIGDRGNARHDQIFKQAQDLIETVWTDVPRG